jgi:hypothetical protein
MNMQFSPDSAFINGPNTESKPVTDFSFNEGKPVKKQSKSTKARNLPESEDVLMNGTVQEKPPKVSQTNSSTIII